LSSGRRLSFDAAGRIAAVSAYDRYRGQADGETERQAHHDQPEHGFSP
jgi:hypothetical protein